MKCSDKLRDPDPMATKAKEFHALDFKNLRTLDKSLLTACRSFPFISAQ